jgi:hypothetical protein
MNGKERECAIYSSVDDGELHLLERTSSNCLAFIAFFGAGFSIHMALAWILGVEQIDLIERSIEGWEDW